MAVVRNGRKREDTPELPAGGKHRDRCAIPLSRPAPANDDRKAIVTTTSSERAKLLHTEERAAEPDDDPEAPARVKAFFACMVRPPN